MPCSKQSTILYGDPITFSCVNNCSFPYFANIITGMCDAVCSINYFKNNLTRICVQNCYDPSNELYGD